VETVGIEPTLAACKTAVLPLNDVPVNFKTNCRCSGRASQTLAPSARASTNLPGRPENEKPLAGGMHRRGSLIFRSVFPDPILRAEHLHAYADRADWRRAHTAARRTTAVGGVRADMSLSTCGVTISCSTHSISPRENQSGGARRPDRSLDKLPSDGAVAFAAADWLCYRWSRVEAPELAGFAMRTCRTRIRWRECLGIGKTPSPAAPYLGGVAGTTQGWGSVAAESQQSRPSDFPKYPAKRIR
jgi:hypothetical protein